MHCLAFADSLDYDVGEKAEKKIKEYVTIAGIPKGIMVCGGGGGGVGIAQWLECLTHD